DASPGPSSFRPRRPIAFPGRSGTVRKRPDAGSPSLSDPVGPSPSRGADEGSADLVGVVPPAEFAAVAARVFGDRLGLAEDFARLLVTEGVVRGLIGPREAPRIWERHLLNCAVMSEIIPIGASVVDVGSGAGLARIA